MHGVRSLVRRAGAAQLLVQLALRRLRDLRRHRHQVPGRSGVDRPRRRPVDRRGRDRAVVGLPRRVLQARARRGRRRQRLLDRDPVEEAEGRAEEDRALRRGRQADDGSLQEPLRAPAFLRDEVRGCGAVGAASAHGDRLRSRFARPDRGLHAPRAVPCVRRAKAAAARGARGDDRRQEHLRGRRDVDHRFGRVSFKTVTLSERDRHDRRSARVQGSAQERLQFTMLDVGLDYLLR